MVNDDDIIWICGDGTFRWKGVPHWTHSSMHLRNHTQHSVRALEYSDINYSVYSLLLYLDNGPEKRYAISLYTKILDCVHLRLGIPYVSNGSKARSHARLGLLLQENQRLYSPDTTICGNCSWLLQVLRSKSARWNTILSKLRTEDSLAH